MPLRLLTALLTSFLIVGCTTTTDQAMLDGLYEQISLQNERFDTALELWERGEIEAAEVERESALNALQEASERCAVTSGCDLRRFLLAYGDLLKRHSMRFEGTSEGFGARPDEAPPEEIDESPVLAHLPEAGRTITLLKGRELGEIIAINGPVKAALNEWLTWMRPSLIDAWENYQYLRYQMWPVYQEAGLPEALLFGILAKESGGKVHAVSRAGAAGPLQFMPGTGKNFGLGRDASGFDTRFDPAMATRANVRYLNERFGELNNDLALALAAYNGGEGRMRRLAKRHRHPNFWDPQIYSWLPAETRDYVPMVLAAAWLFLHPEDYGLNFPAVENSEPAQLVLEQGASLNALAVCLGDDGNRNGWFRTLRNLNPRYEPHKTIPAGTELTVPAAIQSLYTQHCIAGERFAMALDVAKAAKIHPSRTVVRNYKVQPGDNLGSIARRHHCSSLRTLANANGIKGPKYLIRAGQILRLQSCRG